MTTETVSSKRVPIRYEISVKEVSLESKEKSSYDSRLEEWIPEPVIVECETSREIYSQVVTALDLYAVIHAINKAYED